MILFPLHCFAGTTRISKEAGFTPLPMVSKAVELSEKQDIVVRAADGIHWSPQGHSIAGNILAKQIERLIKVDSTTIRKFVP